MRLRLGLVALVLYATSTSAHVATLKVAELEHDEPSNLASPKGQVRATAGCAQEFARVEMLTTENAALADRVGGL